jgi:hypothetical protein
LAAVRKDAPAAAVSQHLLGEYVLADPDCSEQNPFQRGWVWPLENIRSLHA